MKTTFAALVLMGGASLLVAQDRFDFKVRNYFFTGFSGDQASLDKGMKICEDSLGADPKNAEALVWHGAGLFYESGQAFRKQDMQKGGELWARGLKEMEDAVALAPDQLGVVIPRGAVLLTAAKYVPSPEMARPLIETGVADFEKVYQLQAQYLDQMGTHPRGEQMATAGWATRKKRRNGSSGFRRTCRERFMRSRRQRGWRLNRWRRLNPDVSVATPNR
jgi:hypothetical protein